MRGDLSLSTKLLRCLKIAKNKLKTSENKLPYLKFEFIKKNILLKSYPTLNIVNVFKFIK